MAQQRTFEEIAQDVKLAQAGDAGAMERILGDVQDMVHYTCLRMLRSEDKALDAAQDILIAVYRKVGTLADPMTYMGWVKQITANRCRNILSKTNREFLLEENEEGEDPFASFEDLDEQKVPDKALDNAESRRMVNDIVDALPDGQRLCVMLYYYDEMKTREIASALQVSEGTVKSRLNYARKAIKTGVDRLAKQGVKLYGGAPLPFLGYILQQSAATAAAPALVVPVMAAAAGTAAAAATATAATASVTAAAAAAATGTGATAATAGLGAFFTTLAGKAVAAVIAVAVIGGTAAGVTRAVETRRAAEALAAATAEPTAVVTMAPATHTPAPTNTPAPTAEPTPTPTSTPTPTPEPPEHTFQRMTELPEEETAYLLDRFSAILAGENELGFVTDSLVAEIWEIHSLAAYRAFRETEAWEEDVPESELPCYGVRLADGTVLYLYLGDGLAKDGAMEHPWEIYRVWLPEGGGVLYSLDYLSGPQWTEWSTEYPPEKAIEIQTLTQYRGRVYLVDSRAAEGLTEESAIQFCQGAVAHPEPYAFATANYYLEEGQNTYGVAMTWFSGWSPWLNKKPSEAELASLVPAVYGYDATEIQSRILYRYRRR